MRRSAAMIRITLGQYSCMSASPAHLSHTTNITLSRIRCERYIFLKKCVHSFLEVRHYCWLCFRLYLYYVYVCDVLLWTPTYGRAKAGRLARTYIQQLCEDTGCSPKDLPKAMNDREKWRQRVRDIRAGDSTRWWWWWWYVCSYTTFVCLGFMTYQTL